MTENVRSFGVEVTDQDTHVPESSARVESSVYDDLRAALSESVEVEAVEYIVPQRPSVEMIFKPDIEFDLLRSWMNAASRNKKKEFNPLTFAYQVISTTNTGITFNGHQEFDSEGTPLTVTHKELQVMLGAHDVTSAVRRLYGIDGHIIQVAQKVVEAAGYDDIDLEGGTDPLGR